MKPNVKKRKKSIVLFFLIFFLIITVLNSCLELKDHSSSYYDSQKLNIHSSGSTERIHIVGNEGWYELRECGNVSGFGNTTHPYILKDLEINGEGIGSCIIVEESSVYFKIENCIAVHSGNEKYDAGIKLVNVTNGEIVNNNCSNNKRNGIILIESNNNHISENYLSYNNVGVHLISANHNTVLDNAFSSNENDIEEYNSYGNIFTLEPNVPFEIVVIIITVITVGLSCSIAIPIIYQNMSAKKQSDKELPIKREDKIYHRDKLLAESSKSLLVESVNKELMLKAFNPETSFKDKPFLANIKFSTISDYFLNKVDSLGMNVEDKKEFLKEMFTFTPRERLEMIEDILEKMKTPQ